MSDSNCPDCGGYLYWHKTDCPRTTEKLRARIADLEAEVERLRSYIRGVQEAQAVSESLASERSIEVERLRGLLRKALKAFEGCICGDETRKCADIERRIEAALKEGQ